MTQRGLTIGLLISVALNFALAGVLVGDRFLGQANALGGAPLNRLVEAVPPDARPAVREALKLRRFELLGSLRAVRQARARVHRLAVESPVPRAELKQAFADLRTATNRVQLILHQALLDGLVAPERPADAYPWE